jgi:hypothetical protein
VFCHPSYVDAVKSMAASDIIRCLSLSAVVVVAVSVIVVEKSEVVDLHAAAKTDTTTRGKSFMVLELLY